MQVTDANVIEAGVTDAQLHESHLRTFSTIDQYFFTADFQQLPAGMSVAGRSCAAGAQYGDFRCRQKNEYASLGNIYYNLQALCPQKKLTYFCPAYE